MANQGCINEGTDTRKLGWLVCPIQKILSWKSQIEPLSIVLAFPSYLCINIPIGRNKMLMFRIGWRYDKNWRGFIFPTGAIKRTDSGLLY